MLQKPRFSGAFFLSTSLTVFRRILASTFRAGVASWSSEDTSMALTALQVRAAKPGDKLGDGGGLRLDVDRSGNKAWVFRFTSPTTGKERFMGLGPLRDVSLAQARDAAAEARALIRERKDPIEHRKEQRTAAKVEASKAITFKGYAEQFISGREAAWKNPRHRQAWRNSLRDYAYPHIGQLPVADVDTAAILQVLRPIWATKSETASRVRGRIEAILSAAKVEGLRMGDNPALWRGHIAEVLPGKRAVRAVEHHAALP
jgi:integrase-like protein/Arm domain-containing DNA-binding protein